MNDGDGARLKGGLVADMRKQKQDMVRGPKSGGAEEQQGMGRKSFWSVQRDSMAGGVHGGGDVEGERPQLEGQIRSLSKDVQRVLVQERYAEVLHLGSALGVEESVRLHLVREPFFLAQVQLSASFEKQSEVGGTENL